MVGVGEFCFWLLCASSISPDPVLWRVLLLHSFSLEPASCTQFWELKKVSFLDISAFGGVDKPWRGAWSSPLLFLCLQAMKCLRSHWRGLVHAGEDFSGVLFLSHNLFVFKLAFKPQEGLFSPSRPKDNVFWRLEWQKKRTSYNSVPRESLPSRECASSGLGNGESRGGTLMERSIP